MQKTPQTFTNKMYLHDINKLISVACEKKKKKENLDLQKV